MRLFESLLLGCPLCPFRDCKVFAVDWPKFSRRVVLKQYDKSLLSSIKFRSIKREARMMYFLTRKGYDGAAAHLQTVVSTV